MSASGLLVIDVGNTRTKLGVFDSNGIHAICTTAVCPASDGSLSAEVSQWLDGSGLPRPSTCIMAGSNPPVRDRLQQEWPWPDMPIHVVASAADIPLELDVENPGAVGVDRLLTAFAAVKLFGVGRTTVVIDSGTATTVDLVTSDGVFRGGTILPGLRLSAFALHDYTARLPLVDTDGFGQTSDDDLFLPGRNTIAAISAGLFWGQLGAIREIAGRLEHVAAQRFLDRSSPLRLLSGGGGRQLVRHFFDAQYIDSLALYGLALLSTNDA